MRMVDCKIRSPAVFFLCSDFANDVAVNERKGWRDGGVSWKLRQWEGAALLGDVRETSHITEISTYILVANGPADYRGWSFRGTSHIAEINTYSLQTALLVTADEALEGPVILKRLIHTRCRRPCWSLYDEALNYRLHRDHSYSYYCKYSLQTALGPCWKLPLALVANCLWPSLQTALGLRCKLLLPVVANYSWPSLQTVFGPSCKLFLALVVNCPRPSWHSALDPRCKLSFALVANCPWPSLQTNSVMNVFMLSVYNLKLEIALIFSLLCVFI